MYFNLENKYFPGTISSTPRYVGNFTIRLNCLQIYHGIFLNLSVNDGGTENDDNASRGVWTTFAILTDGNCQITSESHSRKGATLMQTAITFNYSPATLNVNREILKVMKCFVMTTDVKYDFCTQNKSRNSLSFVVC